MANGNGNGTLKVVASVVAGVLTTLAIAYSLLVGPVSSRVDRLENNADQDATWRAATCRELGEIKTALQLQQKTLDDINRKLENQ